jgi:hypothetical protein
VLQGRYKGVSKPFGRMCESVGCGVKHAMIGGLAHRDLRVKVSRGMSIGALGMLDTCSILICSTYGAERGEERER